MKRYQSRALMAGALCLALTAQAGALSVSGVAGLGASAAIDVTLDTLEREGINAVPPVQDAQNIGFIGLEKTVRANNLTIQSFHKTLAGIANTDLDAQFSCRRCNIRRSSTSIRPNTTHMTDMCRHCRHWGRVMERCRRSFSWQ